MLNKKLLGGSSGLPQDDNFENVTLLLNGDGTNGGQNNTFVDSSTNNFTITRNGNTTQGSFSPYGTLWSNYFDGSGDYLRSTATTISDFGTNNFTFEAWIYPTAVGTTEKGIYDGRATDGSGTSLIVKISTGSKIVVGNPSDLYTSSTTIVANTWYHIAIVRSGTGTNQCALFINGSRDGTFTSSTSFTNPNSLIGAFVFSPIGAGPYSGYISNLRIVKSTAVYDPTQTTCTVPTTPLTAITNTSLLTCQSNRFIDNSSNAFALTITGDVSVQRFSPFEPSAPYSTSVIGGSAYFDGSGDYLSLSGSSEFAIATSTTPFTVECWAYLTASTTGTIFAERFTGSGNTVALQVGFDGGTTWTSGLRPTFGFFNGSSWSLCRGTTAVQLNTWTHLAYVFTGSTCKIYVNGVDQTGSSPTPPTTWGVTGNNGDAWYVGSNGDISVTFSGYISNLRFVNGSAVYTTEFTPPTAPLTAITNTRLLTTFQNASIPDLAMMNDLETVGNAQVSTSVKKYGTGSLAFDGNGDYLQGIANDPKMSFTGDFTVEFWAYKSANGVNGYDGVCGCDTTGNGINGWAIELSSSRGFLFYTENTLVLNDTTNPNDSTWHHYVLTRQGSTLRYYRDGTQITTATYSSVIKSNRLFKVGMIGGIEYFNGYIDDLRITNGLCRYPNGTAFTPPDSALPTY